MLGETPVYFISIKPSKLRFAEFPLQSQVNDAIRVRVNERSDLHYIDIVRPMLANGEPKDIFEPDNLHMTRAGYLIWTRAVRAALLPNAAAEARRCRRADQGESLSRDLLTYRAFGKTDTGRAIELYRLRNHQGLEAQIATYGGVVTSLRVPDRSGHFDDVVLGYDSLAGYLKDPAYFGALIGRYANRIALGRFSLNGVAYALSTNDGPNALHGGKVGFDKVVWTVSEAKVTEAGPQLTLSYFSRNGEEGYPGNLNVTARYTLTEDNSLRLEYTATTDRDTVVNLTQHSYFNLRGSERRGDVLSHIITIQADRFTPVDATLIPTGELRPVEGTPFDFRRPTAIGARLGEADDQIRFGKGYDHNWVLNKSTGVLSADATVYEPESGRVLEVLSTQPGLQFYSGNFLDGSITGKGGWTYRFRSGFCMEPQHFPDSPNHPKFPSAVLRPGQTYRSTIIYRFKTR